MAPCWGFWLPDPTWIGAPGATTSVSLLDGPADVLHVREHGALNLQLGGFPEVVGIQKGDEISGGFTHAVVAGRRYPRILLTDAADGISKSSTDGRRLVRRTVVNDDDLTRWARLVESGLHRRRKEFGAIMSRDHHADPGHG